jgi:hypothetical protein
MDARKAAWIAPALIAGCAAPATIDVTATTSQPTAQELAARSREKLTLGRRYLAAGEEKLGGFLLGEARVDAELASLKAATTRLRTLAARPLRD